MTPKERQEICEEIRQSHNPQAACVDELALDHAKRAREQIACLGISLTWRQWCQITEIVQCEIIKAIHSTAFDPTDFPVLDLRVMR